MTSMLKVVTKTSLIIGLIFLGLLTLSGCEKEKEYDKLFYSVFEISAGHSEDSIYGIGTGFKYKDGELITNFHVIGSKKDGVNTTYSYIKGKIYGCEDYILFDVSEFSYEDDYAVLIPQDKYLKKFSEINELDIDTSNSQKIGDKCFTIGNLFNYGLAMNNGIISSGLKK